MHAATTESEEEAAMARETFGPKVKEARKQAGMSQRQLADRVRIDYGYLSKIERGRVDPPSEEVIIRIARTLGLDRDELLYLAEKAPSDLRNVITEGPYIPAILRRARGLTKEDWKEIEQLIAAKKRRKSG